MEYLLIEKRAWLEMQAEAKRSDDRMKKTLQYYRNSGILPYTVMGNKCQYKPEDVKAILDRCITKQK